jgi:hypothetical protein
LALHPLARIDAGLLRSLTIRLGGLLVFSTALLMFVDVPLQGESSPWGIVSLELAATPTQALRILLEWKSQGALGYAKLSLTIDFVYLLVYALFFSSLALWLGKRRGEELWSNRAAWAATSAAGFDVLENAVLLYELNRLGSPAPFPQMAAGFAAAKLTLLSLSIGYAVVAGIALVRARQRRPL